MHGLISTTFPHLLNISKIGRWTSRSFNAKSQKSSPTATFIYKHLDNPTNVRRIFNAPLISGWFMPFIQSVQDKIPLDPKYFQSPYREYAHESLSVIYIKAQVFSTNRIGGKCQLCNSIKPGL